MIVSDCFTVHKNHSFSKHGAKVPWVVFSFITFLISGCGGVPEHERECQWQGTPHAYCAQTSKVDTYFVKGNAKPYFIPAYTDAKEFPVPDMPIFSDQPLDRTLRESIVLTNYKEALAKTGLLELIERKGPYTVFAVPNGPLEKPPFLVEGSIMDAANQNLLKQLMAYTIVLGNYPPDQLKQLILTHGGFYTLTTYYNKKLTVGIENQTGSFFTMNQRGEKNKIWINGIPQANGTLYVTQSLLNINNNE
ncbi:hypothetical protein COMNV_01024 [Commensalibacter sp. Nvir]|uniref:fasciclin domain-containing protein n=1 Tax=Commensalibacter sp. Nvir TaxID=3069817 RepID=UPI002D425288|nr:hypothetical protein COMNV_01024 [Commensalibacter sp. Nvir]